MLVLSRKVNERIMIGDNIEIVICDIGKGRVRVGVQAPVNVQVARDDCKKGSKENDE
jgi:carbon storage regulator